MRRELDWRDDAAARERASGLAAGTRVATSIGWRPVETLIAGDRVLTVDDGLQTVTRIDRALLWTEDTPCPRHLWPLDVPAGALGNHAPMRLLPEQSVMLEPDAAEDIFGSPVSMMPAAGLDGVRGIARTAPRDALEVVSLRFEQNQTVFANIGALFHCPRATADEILRDSPEMTATAPHDPTDRDRAETLTAPIGAEGPPEHAL